MARKEEHEKEPNHERWLVSYADFITLLFATFTALYALSASDKTKVMKFAESIRFVFGSSQMSIIGSMSNSIMEQVAMIMRQNPGKPGSSKDKEKQKQEAAAAPPTKATEKDLKEVKKEVEEYLVMNKMIEKVTVDMEERGLVISVKEGSAFQSGRADIQPDGYKIFSQINSELSKYTNPIRVEGHTDDVPISSPLYQSNWELSATRATNVVRLLINQYKVDPRRLSATGYGEYRPLNHNRNAWERAMNRRVDIVILSDQAAKLEPWTAPGAAKSTGSDVPQSLGPPESSPTSSPEAIPPENGSNSDHPPE